MSAFYGARERLAHVATKWAADNDFVGLFREELHLQSSVDCMTHDKRVISST